MNLALIDPFVLAQDYPETVDDPLKSRYIVCIRFNRKGDLLAAGREDGTVVVWDLETRGVACKLRGHSATVSAVHFSRNSRYLLSSAVDWKCILWDLSTGQRMREVRFDAQNYSAELHPYDHLLFLVTLFEEQPILVDVTDETEPKKHTLSSAPKSGASNDYASSYTLVATFTATGEHILQGTDKGWLNLVEVETKKVIYSYKVSSHAIIALRLSNSGNEIIVSSKDRVIRTIRLPNLAAENLDPDTIQIEVEHHFQDVVNRLAWNAVAFSSTGEYVTASTYNNHDIYIWERTHGSLVKILEGPREEHGPVEWHPQRPMIVACGLESGTIHVWSIISPQRWSALAPDFAEVEENVEYIEREDEFDIYPEDEIRKRRLDLEDEDVDVITIAPIKGQLEEDELFKMPVILDVDDSESEEEYVTIATGTVRRKTPGEVRDYSLDGDGSADERRASKKANGVKAKFKKK